MSKRNLIQKLPLLYEYKGRDVNIGVLSAVVSLDGIFARLFKKAFTILLSNAVKTFLVSGFVLLIFQYLLTRHLYSLSSWLRNLDIGKSFEKFRLDRAVSRPDKTDELDEVVIAINAMQDNIEIYLKDLIISEKRYRNLFENAVDGVFQSTPEGRFINVNPSFAKIFGYGSCEELIDEVFDIASQLYVDPEDRVRYQQLLKEFGLVENYEYQVRRKDGSQIWVSNSIHANFNQDGKINRYEGTVQDITARKEAEKALQKSEEKFRTLVTNIEGVVYIIDKTGTFILSEGKGLSALGLKPGQVVGKSIYKLYNDYPDMLDKMRKAFDGETITSEVTIESIHFKNWYTPHINHEGEIIGLMGLSVNITKQKLVEDEKEKLEYRLLQSQKMEAIGTLAGGIAHDFNNLLSPILGFSEMLQEDLPKDSPLHGHVTEVVQAALRAKDLAKQILTFSRQHDRELRPVKIQSILKEALNLLRSSIPKTIEIQADIDPDCGVVIADPTQVHQIVMNLATNAYHAMQESGGQLKVTLRQTLIESKPVGLLELTPGRYVLLKVTDTGTGIKKN